ncbi:MAG: DegT/DnrJ/EryC1/StrS family aminotransferase [Marinibacterium sp.]
MPRPAVAADASRSVARPGAGPLSPALAQVQFPLMPRAEALVPYLDRIDATRWYSNRGPLLWELEQRLHHLFGVDEHGVVLLSSGTAALEAAILAHAGPATPDRPLALIPAYTFVATAQAALRCGYQPYFVDVDPDTWMLDPGAMARHARLPETGLILPVAAYGRAPDMTAWETVQAQTQCPVVVDAAAAFERFEAAPASISQTVPAVLSLHATKAFSTAEGGAILLINKPVQWRAGQAANFGQDQDRICRMPGLNGKLSEYHAAVGLAQLDDWSRRKAQLADLSARYQAAARHRDLPGRILSSPDIAGAYILYHADTPEIGEAAVARLAGAGIGHRRWYGTGLHHQPVFDRYGRDDLTRTERLGACQIGLPAAVDLTSQDITRILDLL